MYEIKVITTISAAHSLRNYPGDCKNIHGHNYKVEVVMQSEGLDNLGMAIDFRMLRQEIERLLQTLDHTYINDKPPFDTINPTAENLSQWIYDTLSKKLNRDIARVCRVNVWENENSSASYFD
ncbi:MAG: 6-carboxytetrahydropterin synthase QueD [Nitrospirae bacterium RIFCSPLOW2_12_42_9]|nr:MAG: 6-carboxytetrahydropterin synthase QueD [Nitrospirae bacterium GWA2_42_11]OGW59321.1 MAG: 6-carboxytetrahydropterin synthase QueD [Nitrospirae bacterium RIFCSPLOW2_12_42_9]HAS17916.1 6-carboxytetrahydropterin synthase QueD [Nitrospiraceae bacterium]